MLAMASKRTSLFACTVLVLLSACGGGSSPPNVQERDSVPAADAAPSVPKEAEKPPLSELVTNSAALAKLDLCEGLPTDTDRREVKAVARPPFGKRYADPAFGTTVIRITNSSVDELYKPAYSTMQPWNADESLLLLYRNTKTGVGHILLDGFTYEPISELDIAPADLEEVFWSHSDPDTLFYMSSVGANAGSFIQMNVRTQEKTVLRNFADVCGEGVVPVSGGGVHMHSLDDDSFGFRCDTPENSLMLRYKVSTDDVHAQTIGEGTPWEDSSAPQPLAYGNRYWLQGRVLELDLNTVATELDVFRWHEHADLGLSWDKREVLYATAFDGSEGGCNEDMWRGVGHLIEHDLNSGECRSIVSESDGFGYTTRGTHISARAIHKPGWVAMSSIGYGRFELFSNKRRAPALFSEVYLVDTNPNSERVCRVAQHRSYAKDAQNGDYAPYFGEPHATISPSGTRIAFGSDWYDSGSVDTYIVELPAYQSLIDTN